MNKAQDIALLYQEAFNRNFDDEYKSLRRLRELAQEGYESLLKAEQKRRQPRARVRFKDLPEDVVNRIRSEVMQSPAVKEINRLTKEVEVEKLRREKLLETMAPSVEMEPDPEVFYRLQTATSLSYGSQGYGAMKYAKGSLEPLGDMLVVLGFQAHIKQGNFHRGRGTFAVDHADYQLWANCPPWMFDAAHRCLTLADAVASMKRRCINPLVYNPFLPDSCRL